MTDEQTDQKGSELAVRSETSNFVEGLEDVSASDLTMPMIKIIHDEAMWEDSLSGQRFDEIDVVLLGLIKQRVLWPSEVSEDAEAPLCRSYNFTVGIPGDKFSVSEKRDPNSPMIASGFTADEVESGELACGSCNLKEWGSHPSRDVPWCVEQYVFAVMLGEPDEDLGSPAILTLQRSSMKPAKSYITSFVRTRQPLFVARTNLKLDARSRGSVRYSVPKFVKGVPTDPDFHGQYAEMYRQVKEFVATPPVVDEPTPVVVSTKATVKPKAAPVQSEVPVAAATGDSDLPF